MHRCTGLSMAVPLLQAETLEVPSEAQTQRTTDTSKICASTRFGQCFSESKFFKQNSTTVTIFKKKNYIPPKYPLHAQPKFLYFYKKIDEERATKWFS